MAQCLRTLLLFQRAGVWFPAYMSGGSHLPVTLAPDDPMTSVLHRHLYPSDTYTKIKIILLLRDTCKCAVCLQFYSHCIMNPNSLARFHPQSTIEPALAGVTPDYEEGET